MFDFVEKKLETQVSEHKINKMKKYRVEVNPVLYRNYNPKTDTPDVTILVGDYLSNNQIYTLRNFIFKQTDTNMLKILKKYLSNIRPNKINFQIICSLKVKPTKKDLDKEIIKFYRDKKIDLRAYIPENSVVVTMGRALYSITSSNDLEVYGFMDIVFNKSYFYASNIKCHVFPAWNYEKLYKRNYDTFFSYYQFVKASYFKSRKIRHEQITKIKVDNPNEFLKSYFYYDGLTSIDLETKSLDPWNPDGKIICLTLTFDGKTGYYLPFNKIDPIILEQFLENKKCIGTNLGYDIKWLHLKAKINFKKINWIGDTLPLGQLLNEMRRNGLKPHAWIYTTLGGYDLELDFYLEKYPKCKSDYSLIPEKILFPYATTDPCVTFKTHEIMYKQMQKIDKKFPLDNGWSLERFYNEVMIPFYNVFLNVELNGMCIDWNKLDEVAQKFNVERLEKRNQIYKSFNVTEEDFDLDSTESLGKFLESIGWECIERAKKGHYKSNDYCLKKWEKKSYKEAKLISQYRSMCTIYNTFLGDKNKKINTRDAFGFFEEVEEESNNGYWKYKKEDGKIHPNFGVMFTNTLRNFCKNPNTQNLLSHGKYVKMLRSYFSVPSNEYYLGEDDGAGLQLRICAILSGDEGFIDAFLNKGGDLHSMTGRKVFCPDESLETFMANKKDKDQPYADWRFKAKAVNFSLIFHTTAFAFAKSSLEPNWTLQEAKDYIKKFNLKRRRTELLNILNNMDGSRDDYIDDIDEKIFKELMGQNEEFSYYWAVAEDIKKKFFEDYSGVEVWINNQIKFAEKNGYVRSTFGVIRRLPQLIYYDHKNRECKKEAKGYHNIACNSPVQTYEIYLIAKTMIGLQKFIDENNLKTKLIGQIHDSIVSYKYKDEIEIITKEAKRLFEEDIPENKGIPQILECEISDYHAEFGSDFYYEYFDEKEQKTKIADHRYWKFGKEVN